MSIDEGHTGGTGEYEAYQRKLHERIGAWFADHWTQIVSWLGGALVGAATVYSLLAAQVDANAKATADLKIVVTRLDVTVSQLVTQQQLAVLQQQVRQLIDWKCYAQQYRGHPPPAECNGVVMRGEP